MKTISLISAEQISASKVSDRILENFPFDKTIVQNDFTELFVGTYPFEFYIIFDDFYDIHDESSLFDNDELKLIPSENNFVVELYYRNEDVALNILSTLVDIYPNLYICHEQSGFIGLAKDFIK